MGELRVSQRCLTLGNYSHSQYHKFEDLVRRYEAHRATHRRLHRGRKPANVQNPVGDLLGSWDDRVSVEPGDEYVRDGFVVDDGEGEDENSQEEGNGPERIMATTTLGSTMISRVKSCMILKSL